MGIHAARVAARLRGELGIDVDEVAGAYGEFAVLVDGVEVARSGSFGWIGVLPPYDRVRARVRQSLSDDRTSHNS